MTSWQNGMFPPGQHPDSTTGPARGRSRRSEAHTVSGNDALGFTRPGDFENEFTSVTAYHNSYAVIALLGVVGVGFVAATFGMWRLIRPHNPTRQKLLAYECGIDAIGETWTQPNIRYYIFAFLFVVFDVEAAFLFPWALVYEKLGLYAVVEMILFVVILLVGLVYAWGRRLLDWV